MRSAAHQLPALILATLLAGTSAFAGPTIATWSHESTGEREQVTLRWTEESTFEVSSFPGARQVIVVIPNATMTRDTPRLLRQMQSRLVERARLQEITLPNGTPGVQLSLQLSHWCEPTPTADGGALQLSFATPDALRTEPLVARGTDVTAGIVPVARTADTGGLEFDDAKASELAARAFGSWDAPLAGAGQPAAVQPPSAYYVPPTGTRRAVGGAVDDTLVQSKLNENVRRVDFQGTTMENVLRLISEEAELNLLINPADVAGKTVTLRLRNVTLRQMMDAILKNSNLGYTIEDGGILRIVPRDQVKSSAKETITEVIPINWLDAEEVRRALSVFLDEQDGKIEAQKNTNAIIVRDVPENVQVIQDLIEKIDIPEKQVLIELRMVNMTESARRAVGARTEFQTDNTVTQRTLGDDGSIGSRSMSQSNSSSTNSTNNFNSNNSSTNSTFNRSQTSNSTGNSSNQSSTTLNESIFPTNAGSFGLLAPEATALGLTSRATLDIFGRDVDVTLALNAQEERGEAVTLANPTVLTLNNTEASVEIQRQIPYVSAVNSDVGSVGTIEFKDVGTQVTVLPRISNNGYIMMSVEPEQIIDTGERPQGVPVTDERRVQAAVIVKDEQTIAIGGLRQFEAVASESGVPYLLRIPVLSWLFKTQLNSQNKTELYLFVTPHIIKDPTPTAYQRSLYEKIDYNWDLPDYFFDEVIQRRAPDEDKFPRPGQK